MNLKKFLTTLLMVCASPAVFACDAYIGGALGIGSLDNSYRVHNLNSEERHYVRGGGLSFLGGGQIGVEDWFDNCWCRCGYLDELYAALELNFLYNSQNRVIRSDTDTTGVLNAGLRVKQDFLFGIDLKWGARFCSATPYIVTGYSLGVWESKLLNFSGTDNLGFSGHRTRNKTRSGFKLGTGVRYDVCDCVFFDMQYSYTWFGKEHRQFTQAGTGPGAGTWKHELELNQQRVIFGFNWIFGNY